jgi:hypothetical protein
MKHQITVADGSESLFARAEPSRLYISFTYKFDLISIMASSAEDVEEDISAWGSKASGGVGEDPFKDAMKKEQVIKFVASNILV